MPKVGMEPRRRADVINATLTCISNYGMEGMTLDKVAEYADCSKGVVTYYYQNKHNLTIEAFKSFLAYYGQKIESEINNTMTAEEMIDIMLKHLLPPKFDDTKTSINVSQLEGMENMFISYQDQARLFLQFFSKAALDKNLQEVVSKSYVANIQGIAKIFNYGNNMGQMSVVDPQSSAYGLLAMVIGLSFFRVANIPPVNGEDNRYICNEYVRNFTS